MCGTDDDPQDASLQINQLVEAGAVVFRSTSEAVAYINSRLPSVPDPIHPPVAIESLQADMAAINVGLESFYDSLRDQGAEAVQVDWRPPAGGNEKLMSILAKMKR